MAVAASSGAVAPAVLTIPSSQQQHEILYKLHPVVVFMICDHYKRRNKQQRRVVGGLLGERLANGVVVIRSCFPVLHSEFEDFKVGVEVDQYETMLTLMRRVAPKEQLVGWYASGDIDYYTYLLHTHFKEADLKNSGSSKNMNLPFVHLNVDVNLSDFKLGVKAFHVDVLSAPFTQPTPTAPTAAPSKGAADGNEAPQPEIMARFDPVPYQLFAVEAEKIGIDALIRSHPEEDASKPSGRLDAPAVLATDADHLENALQKLLDTIDSVSHYVDKVVEGKVNGDLAIGKALNDAISMATMLPPDSAGYHENMQDVLMAVYLTNLTRAQLALAQKLHAATSTD